MIKVVKVRKKRKRIREVNNFISSQICMDRVSLLGIRKEIYRRTT